MSLKNKLILLFMGLAIVPLLVLAAFSYWHAQNLLRSTVQAQLQERAMAIGRELAETEAGIEGELTSLAQGFLIQEGAGDQATARQEMISPGSILARAAFLRFRGNSGRVRMLEGAMAVEPIRCSDHGGSRILEFSIEAVREGTPGTLTAGFWASDLFGSRPGSGAHSIHLIDPVTHEVLFSGDCQLLQGASRLGSAWDSNFNSLQTERSGSFKYQEDGEIRLGAYAEVSETGWGVIATSPQFAVISSLGQMALAYWVFVLGLAFSTAIAFSMLLGKFTKSLQELARAAEEIGTGELDPWLPLPTSGEVGQLTLAFSRMLARIRLMMTKVDQSGRLAVVGQLSAYLAHEIRNPLSSIKLNLQRLQRWTRNGSIPEFCLEPVEISLKEVERLSASVAGVLELSSSPDSPLEAVSLHGLVGEAADLLAARFRRQGVALTLELDAEADRVLARVGQIKSVVLNLMVNALEAQPTGGRLEIRSCLSRAPEFGGPVVALHFKDDGGGVSPEIRDRIFEPFFTTKAGGSGIGLAMASRSLQDCMGDLYLEPSFSTESGAEFVLVLPLAAVETKAMAEIGQGFEPWTGVPPRWRGRSGSDGRGSKAGEATPPHLMTPEGLKAVLSLSQEDPEEVN